MTNKIARLGDEFKPGPPPRWLEVGRKATEAAWHAGVVGERVLIAGCGDVGTAAGRRLAAAGARTWALRRGRTPLSEPLEPLVADLTRPETLSSLPDALDAVVYCATPDERTDEAYRRIYVDGLANVLEAVARRQGPAPRVLFTSSTSVFGQSDGSWVDEASPAQPVRFTGRRILEAERLLSRWSGTAIALRLGGIYGPGRLRLVDSVRAGTAVVSPGGGPFTNRIHRDDAAACIAWLLQLEDPAPCYLGVDTEPARLRDVASFIAERLHVDPPRVTGQGGGERRGGGKRCSSARLVATGFGFRYPTYREGYADLLADVN